MEAWCPRQQLPGVVLGGECVIMKAGAGQKSTATTKSQRKQLQCHLLLRPAQTPDSFFYFSVSRFHTSFEMIFSSKERKTPNVQRLICLKLSSFDKMRLHLCCSSTFTCSDLLTSGLEEENVSA